MKRQHIRFLIILIFFAVLGLLVFQGFWIKQVMDNRSKKLNEDLHDLLVEVALKLEDSETIKLSNTDYSSKVMWLNPEDLQSDTVSFFESTIEKKTFSKSLLKSDSLINNMPVLGFQMKRSDGQKLRIQLDPDQEKRERGLINAGVGLTKTDLRDNQQSSFNKILQKFKTITKYYEEIGKRKLALKDRIDFIKLDSLIDKELKRKGIITEFEFEVLDDNREKVIYKKGGKPTKLIKSTGISTPLFPNDLSSANATLWLSINNQRHILLKKIVPLIAISIFLIGIILTVFSYSLYILLKQKRLSEMKNDFINNMTHEFKTPIATVSLATEALGDSDMRSHEKIVDRYVGIIKEENQRLATQVEKVLQMAALDKQQFNLKRAEVNIHDLIKKSIDQINLQVVERNGHITSQLSADNPVIIGDELHLSNIIRNLLENANKYSPSEPYIHVSSKNEKDGICIEVKDEGIGMKKEDVKRIFEKFFRVHTGNVHDIKGFGLGLAYVKTMVEAHGGAVGVSSEPFKGSVFSIYLPYSYEKK